MKLYIKTILFYFFMLTAFSSLKCQKRNFQGETQAEMNSNASSEFTASLEKMQRIFNEALSKHMRDPLFIDNLKKSQKQWEIWRDAEIETFYPKYKDSSEFYGSMQPLCRYSKLIEWTEQRIEQLEIYSDGVESDDACGPGKL